MSRRQDSNRNEWFSKSRAVAQAFRKGRTRRVRPTSGGAAEGANRRFATVAANPVDPMRRRVPDYETAGFYCIEISGDRTPSREIKSDRE